ncbi:hypothetical protein KFL_002640250 [Klebsormidium nitens]|uniref:Nuclear segregation protein n=1 Tax=Klebsormidium nitens TaxID=105231 RepID=A0A0U9HMU8_KLENI|nr:hypothetical protein KFL_002640250 [Klebsormidium nitens]|eukprot:GAQ86004.1 hypothetical protein KFL_002640250 [Klebsormidium nitens]
MAEATVAADAPSTAPDAAPEGDHKVASKGERTERVKRLDRPNRAALEEEVAKLNQTVDQHQARIQEIKVLIDNKKAGRQGVSGEVAEARNKLNELVNHYKALIEEKNSIKEELKYIDQAREKAREEAKSLKSKLPYVRVEQIDEEVKKLEYKMHHTSLTMAEEKRTISQINELTKSREFVKVYNERMDKLSGEESSRGEVLERIRQKDAQINAIKAQESEQRRLLNSIRDKEQSHTADIPGLHQERSELYDKISELKKQGYELRQQFRAKEQEWYEREQEWRKQEGERRKAQRAVWDAERKVKEEAWKARQAENFVEPYTDEIIKCDQLTAMLQKYAPAQAAAAAAPKTEIKMPEGVSILKKDRDAGMDGWFGGLGGGSKKGKNKGGGAKDKSTEKLSLSLDALASLQSVSVAAPLTVGDVMGAIEKVKEKKVHYQELQKEERVKREAKAAAEKEGVVEKEETEGKAEGDKEEDEKETKEEDEADANDAEEETDAASKGETKAPEAKKVEANGVAKVEKKEDAAEEAAEEAEEAEEAKE